jgi:UDPglucose 6-dehydrogenase
MSNNPLFIGLTHIGQVFALGWAEKIGGCAVYDFNEELREKFKNGELTKEEPGLPETYKKCIKQINIYKSPEQIQNNSLVIITIDTPLTQEGEPIIEEIKIFLQTCIPFVCEGATVLLTSQVYCGFCDELKETILKERADLKLIYWVDTLKMGVALSRFINPEQLIFGVENDEDVPDLFQQFDCPKYFFSYKQAEMVKMGINLFLMSSVTFANAMDNYCREFGFSFSTIADSLRQDERIGKKAYISPSLGISGGHLERDHYTVIQTCRDTLTRKLFENMRQIHVERMSVLYRYVDQLIEQREIDTILWIGASYKKESLSLVNSPFLKCVGHFGNKLSIKVYDSCYAIDNIDDVEIITDLESELNKTNCAIFNYGSYEDINTILNTIKNNPEVIILDISLPTAFEKDIPNGIHRVLFEQRVIS